MEVIPLTLALSLLLSLTFIALFVREFTRPRRAGAEHESLLPLENDLVSSRAAAVASSAHSAHGQDHDHAPGHAHAPGDDVCASRRTDGRCCASCQRRKDRAAARAATPTA